MMKKLIVLILASFLFVFPLEFQKYRIIIRTAVGYGRTENEAIQEALMEVIKQIYGVDIKAFTYSESKSFEEIKNKSEQFYSKDVFRRKIRERFKGFINSYRVLWFKRVGKEYKVKVKAKVKLYNPILFDENNKINVAIYGFDLVKTNLDYPPYYLRNLFIDTLEDVFSKSNIFNILDRRNEKFSKEEFSRIFSKETRLQERVKFGRKLGADLILTGSIRLIEFTKRDNNSSSIPWIYSAGTIDYIVHYSLIALASSKVISSKTFSGKVNVKGKRLSDRDILNVFKDISEKILLQSLIDIFPPRVIWVSDKKVIISLGRLEDLKGKKFKTIHSNKRFEYRTGLIEIKDVYKNASLGNILEGYPKVGDYLYPIFNDSVEGAKVYRKSRIKVLDHGVKLPWD